MTRRYYLLLERDGPGARWDVQFGDYDREVVDQERRHMHDTWRSPRLSDLKVISVDADDSVSIKATLDALNTFVEKPS